MRVRIELRRHHGAPIPRFRPQTGFRGRLITASRDIEGIPTRYLFLRDVERENGFPPKETPYLFAAGAFEFHDDHFRAHGYEIVERTHYRQSWDIYTLPELRF